MQTGEITHQALAGRGYWQTWTVSKILQEDKYTGDMVQGRTKTVLHRQVPAGEENLIVVTGTHSLLFPERFLMLSRSTGQKWPRKQEAPGYSIYAQYFQGADFLWRLREKPAPATPTMQWFISLPLPDPYQGT